MPKRICVVHIGTEDTGASAFQHAMVHVSDELPNLAVCYPTAGRFINSHDTLALELSDWNNDGTSHGQWSTFERQLSNSTAQAACISSVHFSHLARNQRALERLFTLIRRADFEPSVALFVRPQIDRIEAIYARTVIDLAYAAGFKVGAPQDFTEYLEEILTTGRYRRTGENLDYYQIAHGFAEVFGTNNVRVRPYISTRDTVQALLALISDKHEDILKEVPPAILQEHVIPYSDAFHALRIVANSAQLQESLETAGKCPFEPATNAELQLFEQRFAESNDALAAQFRVTIPAVSRKRRALAERITNSSAPESRALRSLQDFVHDLDLSRARAFSNLMTSHSHSRHFSSTRSRICYVHIGTHKTGTTAIQYSLTENEDAMLKCGLYYPFQGRRGINHANIAWELYAPSLSLPERGTLNDLGDELQAANAPICCISAEDFEYISSEPESIRRLINVIRNAGYEVRIILFVRPQADYLEADYAQLAVNAMFYGDARAVPATTPSAYLDEVISTGAFQQIGRTLFEYDVLADAFASVVGLENTIVRPYRADESVIPEFLNIIFRGEKMAIPTLGSAPRAENTRASFADVLHCQRVDASSHPGLAAAIAVAGDRSFRPFNREIIQRIQERFESSNIRLLHRYGVVLPTVSSRRLSFMDWVETEGDSVAEATRQIQSFFADYDGSALKDITSNHG